MRNRRLKARHRVKRIRRNRRSMNNLNDYDVNDSSLYGWDDDSPFYPKDNIGDKPVLKGWAVESVR